MSENGSGTTKAPLERSASEQDDDDLNGMYETVRNTTQPAVSEGVLKKSSSTDSSNQKPKKEKLKKSGSLDSNAILPKSAKDGPVGFYDVARQPSNASATYETIPPLSVPVISNIGRQEPAEVVNYETEDFPSHKNTPTAESTDKGAYEPVIAPVTQKDAGADYDVVGNPSPPVGKMSENTEGAEILYDTISDIAVPPTGDRMTKETESKPKQESYPTKPSSLIEKMYSKPNIRKKIPKPLSAISEGSLDESEQSSPTLDEPTSPDDHVAPLPPPRAALYAIEELKRFFHQCEEEEKEISKCTVWSSDSDDVFEESPGSAFEGLKAFLAQVESA